MNKPFFSPEVRVVEASAGSGKTHTLAKRYVQLLLFAARRDPLPMRHVLAITFTNKAAHQMKERIVDLLKRIALGDLKAHEYEDLIAPLGMDKAEASGFAYRLMEELIRQYHFFQAQTIDSFMNALLSGCAFKVGLSARFKIKRNSADYLGLVLDELIAASGRDAGLRRLLTGMVRQYLFLENRTGWFPRNNFLAVLKVLFAHNNTYQMGFLKHEGKGQDLLEAKRKFIALAGQMRGAIPGGTHKRFRDWLEGFCASHTAGFDVDDVNSAFAKEDFPAAKGTDVPPDVLRLWDRARLCLQSSVRAEAYGIFDPYIDLFDRVLSALADHQVKDDVLFLEQLNSKARALFDEGLVTVEELYYRLATRFRHYLIDEFQDTNSGQWANLSMMVEEALSTGGTLFYVGDKKQAIYGFRGGRSELFDQLQDELSRFHVVRETLTKNYRSHRHIVGLNNRIFAVDNLKSFLRRIEDQALARDRGFVFGPSDEQFLEDIYGHAQQEARPDLDQGMVRVAMVAGKIKSERDEIIRGKFLDVITDVRARFHYRDIAVLTRSNAQVAQVSQWLLQEGILVRSERTSDVKNHQLVIDLLNYLKFLDSPVDNISFASFLSGDIFPLVSGMGPQAVRDFLFEANVKRALTQEKYLYKRFRDDFPDLWERYFAAHLQESGRRPLYESAVGICHDWQVLERFPQARGFILHFLELIKRREEDSCDLQSFLEYFEALEGEERFVSINDTDAVRVLTVHKAKGLEFPVVVVPFLEMTVKPGSGDKDGGQSFVWDETPQGTRLLRLKKSYGSFCEDLKERFNAEYKKAFFAELNNVYVALTRAVWEMHVFIPERVGSSINPVWALVPDDARAAGEASRPVDGGVAAMYGARPGPGETTAAACPSLGGARELLDTLVSGQWISRLHEDFAGQDLAGTKARLKGEAMHFCLSCLGDLNGADLGSSMTSAIDRMTGRFPSQDAGAYRAWLNDLLKREDARPLFWPAAGTQVICEQEIVNRFGDTRRIDRLLVSDGQAVVIDFKTSRKDEASHRKQIDEYVALVGVLYPGCTVCGEIIYV